MEMKRILAVGVILLFVGVTIAPTINFNTVKASQDDDLVEVTTQACGIKGYENTTVKLTREQYQNLEQYLIGFRVKLNQTSTRGEAVPIFKEAVVELDKYGLLPKGMSVERVMRLITKSNDQRLKVLDSLDFDPDANYFCLVSGLTSQTMTIGPLTYLVERAFIYSLDNNIIERIDSWFISRNLSYLLNVFYYIFGAPYVFLSVYGPLLTIFIPFGVLSILTFGTTDTMWGKSISSSGWVFSVGLNGMKNFFGSDLWGTAEDFIYILIWMAKLYPGVLGFTGLKITLLSEKFDKTFFLGSALKVKLGTEFPG